MSSLKIKCPHCAAELEVEEEWNGEVTSCPFCNQEFIVKLNPKKNFKDKTVRKHKYIWGRLYIQLSKIGAIGCIVIGSLYCISAVIEFSDKNQELYSKLENKGKKIVEFQTKTLAQYNATTSLLVKKGSKEISNGVFNGLSLPDELMNPDIFFSGQLTTLEEVHVSSQAMGKLKEKLVELQTVFQKPFNNAIKSIDEEIANRKGNSMPFTVGKRRAMTRSSKGISVNLYKQNEFYSQKPNFAEREFPVSKDFKYYTLTKIDVANKYLLFVKNNLIQDIAFSKSTSGIRSNMNDHLSETMQETKETDPVIFRLRFSKYQLSLASQVLSRNWKVIDMSEKLDESIKDQKEKIEKYLQDRKIFFRAMLGKLGYYLLSSVIAAFLTLVFADYLAAHFDESEQIQKEK